MISPNQLKSIRRMAVYLSKSKELIWDLLRDLNSFNLRLLDPANHESKLPQVPPATIITDDDPVSVGSFPCSPAMPLPSSVTGSASHVSSEGKKAPCQKESCDFHEVWVCIRVHSGLFFCWNDLKWCINLILAYHFVWFCMVISLEWSVAILSFRHVNHMKLVEHRWKEDLRCQVIQWFVLSTEIYASSVIVNSIFQRPICFGKDSMIYPREQCSLITTGWCFQEEGLTKIKND